MALRAVAYRLDEELVDEIKRRRALLGYRSDVEFLRAAISEKFARCPHPRDQEEKLPYGTFCLVCKTKIR